MDGQPAQPERSRPRSALADRVYHMLYARITNGEYPANQKLPTEKELAQEFSVSRPILRIALEKLRTEGFVYSRQGSGNYVRAPQGSALGFARVETIADIQRCYEFRMTIESDAAWLAAQRRNREVMTDLEAALEMLRVATGSQVHREDADYAFHVAVARASNNQYYEATMRALREHIHAGMKMHGESLLSDGPFALNEVLAEHTGIYQAILDQDGDRAREIMRQHVKNSRDRLFGAGALDLTMRD
ncbi:FadR family transcriptional regulator [Roseospira marina]|uniref:FadR family transcriptional regulator n=2 Tax=Roseospira marina TaxID=140057 RepID=A0A5M6I7L9_9PROT|nr:FadR family transcriptional regulator [Roseospira marina]